MSCWDPRLDAWILTSYHDVLTALREPRLIPALALSSTPAVAPDGAAHAEFRTEALRALSPSSILQWEAPFTLAANRLADALPAGEPVDLVACYARPWCLQVAAIATGIPMEQCEPLAARSSSIFEAACEPFDEALAAESRTSTVALAAAFQDAPPWTVQMFVALAYSLPALLGNLWLAQIEHPGDFEQLLRVAGPAKAQIRQATADLTIGDCAIARDQRVILRLDLANAGADTAAAHLAFGAGHHSCVGASLVKSTAAIATKALLDRYCISEQTAVKADRFAMRYVSSLMVVLSRR